MKKILPFIVVITSFIGFVGCSKSDNHQTTTTQSLILGTWSYNSSYRSDTVYNNGSITYTLSNYLPKFNFSPQANYMIFQSDGTAYYAQTGWGRGLGGSIFRDTVQYTVRDRSIILSYPSGVNIYSWPNFNYPAYQDTITITSLSANTLTINRKYHYKHLLMSGSELDMKQSVDTLTK